jgi:hypothetical protein
MAQGEWAYAFHNAPLACLLYLAVAVIFAINAAGLLLGRQIRVGQFFQQRLTRGRKGVFIIVAALFLLNWIYRLALGLR